MWHLMIFDALLDWRILEWFYTKASNLSGFACFRMWQIICLHLCYTSSKQLRHTVILGHNVLGVGILFVSSVACWLGGSMMWECFAWGRPPMGFSGSPSAILRGRIVWGSESGGQSSLPNSLCPVLQVFIYTSLFLFFKILYIDVYRVLLFSLVSSCWILSEAMMNSDSTLWSIQDIASAIFLSSAYRAMANDHLYFKRNFLGQSAPAIVDCFPFVSRITWPGIWESVHYALWELHSQQGHLFVQKGMLPQSACRISW